jgi:hypothetical protein
MSDVLTWEDVRAAWRQEHARAHEYYVAAVSAEYTLLNTSFAWPQEYWEYLLRAYQKKAALQKTADDMQLRHGLVDGEVQRAQNVADEFRPFDTFQEWERARQELDTLRELGRDWRQAKLAWLLVEE